MLDGKQETIQLTIPVLITTTIGSHLSLRFDTFRSRSSSRSKVSSTNI